MMERRDLSALAKSIGRMTREYLATALAGVSGRIDSLDQRLKEIPAGQDGKDAVVDYDKVQAILNAEVQAAVKEIPAPKDGAPGIDADPAVIRQQVLTEVEKAVAAIPLPKDGERGEPGLPGKEQPPIDLNTVVLKVLELVPVPKDGKDGLSGKDATPVDIASVVIEVLDKIPAPKDGKDGSDGKDTDPEFVRSLVATEVTRAVAAIPVPKDGKDADPIHPDTISLMVVTEVAKAVASIPRAKDGEPGRDAIQTDTLSMIDVTRSYPRGTYAEHAGGTIRATRNTDPITDGLEKAGWAISRDGFADVAMSQGEDLRRFGISILMTSGKKAFAELQMPIPIYELVYRDGEKYARGSMVSRDGSVWHCNVDSPKGAPGPQNPKEWTLSVKRGADGKVDEERLQKMIDVAVAKAVAALPKPRDGKDLTQMGPDGSKW